jgi:purine catabolism regulator
MVSVRDVLDLPALAGARLVAGHAGVTRFVEEVNVVAAPQTVRHVRHGLLLLASGATLTDDPASLVGLIPRLAGAGLAGLAVKPPRWVDKVPGGALEVADTLEFPLIELPEETPLNDIADAILHVILDHQAARLRRVAEIHERFTVVVLAGGRTRDVVLALQPLLDRPVAVLDPDGAIVAAEPMGAWEGIEAEPRWARCWTMTTHWEANSSPPWRPGSRPARWPRPPGGSSPTTTPFANASTVSRSCSVRF